MEDSSPGCDPVSGEYANSAPYVGETIVSIGKNGAGKLMSVPIPVGPSKLTLGCASTDEITAFVCRENDAPIRKSWDSSGWTGTAP